MRDMPSHPSRRDQGPPAGNHNSPKRTGRQPTKKTPRHKVLRREVSRLGRIFGAVIRRFAGKSNYALVERVRHLSAELRTGNSAASDELRNLLATLNDSQLKVVIRSFTLFLELANLAEDRHRIRVLQERDLAQRPRSESIRAVIADFYEQGLSASKVQELVESVAFELVLTAHPTEAKRRSIRRILRKIQDVLEDADTVVDTREHRTKVRHQLIGLLEILWHTDLIRPWRPTVLQEVERGIAFLPVLWQEAPAVDDDLESALHAYYPSVRLGSRPLISFGTWIGGDRDGNPFVTVDVTKQTVQLLRSHAIESHREICRRLVQVLSLSDRQTPSFAPLQVALQKVATALPELAPIIESQPPLESYRRWLKVIDWRLARTAAVELTSPGAEQTGAYATAEDFLADVQLVNRGLRSTGLRHLSQMEIEPWLDQIRIFGLHSTRLDIRQHAGAYRDALDEIWHTSGMHEAPATLTECDRMELLIKSMQQPLPSETSWSPATAETLRLFQLLRRVGNRFGMAAIGEHVISMTAHASDALTVLLLWRWRGASDEDAPGDDELRLPITPLFETIGDLRNAASVLRAMLENAEYRAHLHGLGDRQTIMVGYSDSTKDGGYLAAQWALYRAQVDLQRVAAEFGVKLTFFHGRGGALGRGGGPAARSVLSLPREAFFGSMRLTEQGEVLAERYNNPQVAHRHFEQLVWSAFTAVACPPSPLSPVWASLMDELALAAWVAYRKLVEHPTFGEYYRAVTPINLVEQLPMGSRPAKRKASDRIEELRAIPWVFSWTQNRCLLPAWFGIGAAYRAVAGDNPEAKAAITAAYQGWPFFKCVIDNAALALAKANMNVFREYCRLAESVNAGDVLSTMILDEFGSSRDAVLEIIGCRDLLDDVPWLQESIRLRNGYVDPLNLAQVELMQRIKQTAFAAESSTANEVQHLASLSVKGIATGMRTTG